MKKLASELAPFLASVANLTDEQWAERDAKIAARLAEESRIPDPAPQPLIAANGWPLLCLQGVEHVDESKPAVAQLAKWAVSERSIAVLSGGVGCGKTTAAAWWAQRNYPRALFVRASTFARASRYGAQRDEWVGARTLVLDDLGTEYTDDKGSLIGDLEELVDVYYGDRKPLLITTNLAAAAFASRYGERITDRLRQYGRWLSVSGGSLRVKP